jgi:hypothetical protein
MKNKISKTQMQKYKHDHNSIFVSKFLICVFYFWFFIFNITNAQSVSTELISNGYLNVNSDPLGLKVYLDGDSIGYTPIRNYPVRPGEYSISLFSSDTIEDQYWKLANSGITGKYYALFELAKIGAGTKQVEIKTNQTSNVFFSLRSINRTPNKIKLGTACCIGTGFTISFLIGFWVAHLVQ